MRFENSVAISTLDASREPPVMLPRPPLVGAPTVGWPEASVVEKVLSPLRERPCSSAKLASAIWPTTAVVPLLKEPVMVPSDPMLKFCSVPLAAPFCWMEVVLLAEAVCVTSPSPLLSNRFQVKVRGLAPSAKTDPPMAGGIVIVGLVAEAEPLVGVTL